MILSIDDDAKDPKRHAGASGNAGNRGTLHIDRDRAARFSQLPLGCHGRHGRIGADQIRAVHVCNLAQCIGQRIGQKCVSGKALQFRIQNAARNYNFPWLGATQGAGATPTDQHLSATRKRALGPGGCSFGTWTGRFDEQFERASAGGGEHVRLPVQRGHHADAGYAACRRHAWRAAASAHSGKYCE